VNALQTVQHLITLANDSGAARGEASNAALAAVRLIKNNDLEVKEKFELEKIFDLPKPTVKIPRIIMTRFAGRCAACYGQIETGTIVRFIKGVGIWHTGCEVRQ